MSYILDALKKSDQDRKQGEIPGLNSFQGQPRPPRSTSRIILYLLIGALIINAVVIGIWVISRDSGTPHQKTVDVSEDIASKTDKEPETGVTKSTGPVALPDEDTPEVPASSAAPIAQGETAETRPPSDQISYIDTTDDNILDPSTEKEEEDIPPKLVKYSSLPLNVRNDLEDISISAHYYANDPRSRMASINGRIMRQGQTVKSGLVLEEITRKGVIFSFRKYRFSVDVFNR